MYVLKRDGRKEPIMFDKITARVRKLCYGLNDLVDPVKVAMRVIEGLYDGVTTSELDNLAAETAATMTTAHPDYALLAARISVSNLHKNTKKSFVDTMTDLYTYVNPRTGKKAPLLADNVYKIIKDNAELLDSTIIYNRDFGYLYFGFKTLERSYLLKLNGEIVERPQHMLMRVSVGIHLDDLDAEDRPPRRPRRAEPCGVRVPRHLPGRAAHGGAWRGQLWPQGAGGQPQGGEQRDGHHFLKALRLF